MKQAHCPLGLSRFHQDTRHPGSVGGFLAARAVFDDDAVGWLQAEAVRRGEEEVRVRLRAYGVLGGDDGVEEMRDINLLKRGIDVVATTGRSDGGLMAKATDMVDDGDDLGAGGDVLGEVLLEELMAVGQ